MFSRFSGSSSSKNAILRGTSFALLGTIVGFPFRYSTKLRLLADIKQTFVLRAAARVRHSSKLEEARPLMARPTLLVAEPEPEAALSVRKLVLETAKFNVLTAHSDEETVELFHVN